MKQIDDIVFKQNKGYVTDPIRVPNGFLILRIVERHEKGLATYEEVENEINERMVEAADASQGAHLSDQAAPGRVSGDQARLRG